MIERKISIILPVYNEGENITKVVDGINNVVKIPKDILIVYDFEKDSTLPFAKRLAKKYKNVKLVKNVLGRGVLNAVKTGFKKAKGKFTVVMPADLADDPNTINKMYKKITNGYDLVCATRYSKGGEKIGGGFIKSLLSKMAGTMTPSLLGIPITDITNGFKMYRREVLKKIEIESTGGWEHAMEITLKAHHLGFKITEVPSVWKSRILGKSHFKFSGWLPLYIRWYFWGIKKFLLKSLKPS